MAIKLHNLDRWTKLEEALELGEDKGLHKVRITVNTSHRTKFHVVDAAGNYVFLGSWDGMGDIEFVTEGFVAIIPTLPDDPEAEVWYYTRDGSYEAHTLKQTKFLKLMQRQDQMSLDLQRIYNQLDWNARQREQALAAHYQQQLEKVAAGQKPAQVDTDTGEVKDDEVSTDNTGGATGEVAKPAGTPAPKTTGQDQPATGTGKPVPAGQTGAK